MSLREQIKSAPVAAGEKMEIAEWGVTVEVRPMSVRGRAEVYETSVGGDGEPVVADFYPALVIASTFDPESGEKVFTNDDAQWLAEQPGGPVWKIAERALQISGLTEKALESGKAGS